MPGIGLDELPAGSDAEILTLAGGGSIISRLAALGFVPGSRVSMVRNFGSRAAHRQCDSYAGSAGPP